MNLKDVANGMASKGEKMHEGMDAKMAKEKAKMHLDMAKQCLEAAGLNADEALQELMMESEAEGESESDVSSEEEDAEEEGSPASKKAMVIAVLKKKQASE